MTTGDQNNLVSPKLLPCTMHGKGEEYIKTHSRKEVLVYTLEYYIRENSELPASSYFLLVHFDVSQSSPVMQWH